MLLPWPVISTLDGLTSRWMSPSACAASSAEATWALIQAAAAGGIGPSRSSRVARSMPSTSRMSMNSRPSIWP